MLKDSSLLSTKIILVVRAKKNHTDEQCGLILDSNKNTSP